VRAGDPVSDPRLAMSSGCRQPRENIAQNAALGLHLPATKPGRRVVIKSFSRPRLRGDPGTAPAHSRPGRMVDQQTAPSARSCSSRRRAGRTCLAPPATSAACSARPRRAVDRRLEDGTVGQDPAGRPGDGTRVARLSSLLTETSLSAAIEEAIRRAVSDATLCPTSIWSILLAFPASRSPFLSRQRQN
jgi:hypothetical protein